MILRRNGISSFQKGIDETIDSGWMDGWMEIPDCKVCGYKSLEIGREVDYYLIAVIK